MQDYEQRHIIDLEKRNELLSFEVTALKDALFYYTRSENPERARKVLTQLGYNTDGEKK